MIKLILHLEFTTLGGAASRAFFEGCCPAAEIPQGKDWFFALKNAGAELQQPAPDNLSLHMHDTLLMLQEQRPRVFNPLSAALFQTALSLLPDLALLRDTAENVLVSNVPRHYFSSTFETAYILPERKLIIDTRSDNPEPLYTQIAADLARVVNDEHQLADFAASHTQSKGITLTDRPVTHLGHYLWNALSAWATLFESGCSAAGLLGGGGFFWQPPRALSAARR